MLVTSIMKGEVEISQVSRTNLSSNSCQDCSVISYGHKYIPLIFHNLKRSDLLPKCPKFNNLISWRDSYMNWAIDLHAWVV